MSFSHVVFSVPPSKEADYAEELRKALRLWNGDGNFLFTSSGAAPSESLPLGPRVVRLRPSCCHVWVRRVLYLVCDTGGVFAEDNGGRVDEASEVSANPRTQKILDAEKATLEGGGVVLRLAGGWGS